MQWNLENLCQSRETALADGESILADAQIFETTSSNLANKLSNATWIVETIRQYENLSERIGRISTYSELTYYQNMEDAERGRFFQNIAELTTRIQKHLLPFELSWMNLPQADIAPHIEDDSWAPYTQWVKHIRRFEPYKLSQDLERYINDQSMASHAWVRLYDECMAELRCEVRGQTYTLTTLMDLTSDTDRSLRIEAFKALTDALLERKKLLTLTWNTQAYEKSVTDAWRKYKTPSHSRHVSNDIDPDVVDAMVNTTRQYYARTSHRYYALKARFLGLEGEFSYEDRNAPPVKDKENPIPYEEARDIVLKSYRDFSPKLATLGMKFFDPNDCWTDVYPSDGKYSGAFSHPAVPSSHPYILLNYQGTSRDVATLAHELGHGVHQILAGKQGYLLANTPLTLAETASIFGERLTFEMLLKRCTTKEEKRALLFRKLDDQINSVMRQVAFYEFERRFHDDRANSEVSLEAICQHFLDTQREALGPHVRVNDHLGCIWGYISHFVHSPFYVYAYAFGECLVSSLYRVYQESPNGFEPRYIELLEAGGSRSYHDLLQPFGLDIRSPDFWAKGLDDLTQRIDELEALL